jgi:hypothetical protein
MSRAGRRGADSVAGWLQRAGCSVAGCSVAGRLQRAGCSVAGWVQRGGEESKGGVCVWGGDWLQGRETDRTNSSRAQAQGVRRVRGVRGTGAAWSWQREGRGQASESFRVIPSRAESFRVILSYSESF